MSMIVSMARRAARDAPRSLGRRTAASALGAVTLEDLLDMLPRLSIRRDAAVTLHRTRPGVVGGERQLDVSAELLEKGVQIPGPGVQVLERIEGVFDAQLPGRRRHELHEALRALRRDRVFAEGGLDGDDRKHELRIE